MSSHAYHREAVKLLAEALAILEAQVGAECPACSGAGRPLRHESDCVIRRARAYFGEDEGHGSGCVCADCAVPDGDDEFVRAALEAERPREGA